MSVSGLGGNGSGVDDYGNSFIGTVVGVVNAFSLGQRVMGLLLNRGKDGTFPFCGSA